jgi:F-type H+-transporting ATPase subunit c
MKFVKTAALGIAVLLVSSASAMAQAGGAATPAIYPFSNLQAFAAGLVIIGAAMGIGGLTKSAVESMARQPEMAANIQTAMIISAALIEGVSFFALIIIGFVLKA